MSGLNCCRDWKKVPANKRHCRVISVIAGKCLDEECTWNTDRAKGRCLYEGRSVRNVNNGMRRLYLQDGPVEGRTELEAIVAACSYCDMGEDCNRLAGAVKRHAEKSLADHKAVANA